MTHFKKSPFIYPFDRDQLVTLQKHRSTLQDYIDSGASDMKDDDRLRSEIDDVGAHIFESRYGAKFKRSYEKTIAA